MVNPKYKHFLKYGEPHKQLFKSGKSIKIILKYKIIFSRVNPKKILKYKKILSRVKKRYNP